MAEGTPPTNVKKSFVTALRRGSTAIKPEVLGPKTVKKDLLAAASKDDPNHPLRGGGERKREFEPRLARRKGSMWSFWTCSLTRTLRIAFRKFENPDVRLSVCRRQRLSGKNHRQLPLTLSSKCTTAMCSCEPNYLLLVGMDGGMGDGTTTFMRLHSALGPCVECLPRHPTLCAPPPVHLTL